MPIYTVTITVEVPADKEREAYQIVAHALTRAKLGEIVHIDSEVVASRPYDEEEEDEDTAALSTLIDEVDEAYERAAARARLNDFEEMGGKDWT